MELCIFKPPTSIMMMGFGLSEERSDPIIECKFFLDGKEDKFTGRQSKKKDGNCDREGRRGKGQHKHHFSQIEQQSKQAMRGHMKESRPVYIGCNTIH
ncbi:hypothetical protein O6P43_013484 [Quillaja saponaria]|uniref:Uncharacterized protein n=1 Tax=Quillaja saponaria TaxID=32244 RepID=A0AAD7LSS1_QUISA|nr:hypothetical protein O6P43_013484 [Quillaja saponaria]